MVSASGRSRGGTQTGNTVVSIPVNCSGERCFFLLYMFIVKASNKNKNTMLRTATFKEKDRSLQFWNEILTRE